MIHEMDIWHESFVKIKEQTKTIEMRLFDEKRSLINIIVILGTFVALGVRGSIERCRGTAFIGP